MRASDVDSCKVPTSDGSGDSGRAIAAVWTEWMRWAIPRVRSAVLATRPLRPFAHQDDAVFGAMLSQPRLRFLLADEPGTGKTKCGPEPEPVFTRRRRTKSWTDACNAAVCEHTSAHFDHPVATSGTAGGPHVLAFCPLASRGFDGYRRTRRGGNRYIG